MTGKKNAAWIGAFVVGAVALAIASLMVFGSGKLFSERLEYVLFFEGSVKGLSVGAPVTFRGVRIGEVTSINVRVARSGEELLIPVLIQLDADRVQHDGPDRSMVERGEMVDQLVERGLRAQLVLQSIVTGQLLVNLELHPEVPLDLHSNPDFDMPELPTIPSPTDELRKTAESVISWVQDLPLQEIFEELLKTVESIGALAEEARSLVQSEELTAVIANIDGALVEVEAMARDAGQVLASLDREIVPLARGVEATLDEARGTLASATSAMQTLERAIDDRSPMRHEISEALREVKAAARSMRALTDGLEQRPESIVFGKEDTP